MSAASPFRSIFSSYQLCSQQTVALVCSISITFDGVFNMKHINNSQNLVINTKPIHLKHVELQDPPLSSGSSALSSSSVSDQSHPARRHGRLLQVALHYHRHHQHHHLLLQCMATYYISHLKWFPFIIKIFIILHHQHFQKISFH